MTGFPPSPDSGQDGASPFLAKEQRLQLGGKGIDAESQDRLLALERELGMAELLGFLNEQVLREQEIFWLRFGAFAAVHAGALVLVTSEAVHATGWLAGIGILLGLSWWYVQWISLKYADRPKGLYHWYRRSLGILWPYELPEPLAPQRWQRRLTDAIQKMQVLSSTDVGVRIPFGVTVLWAIVALTS